MVWKDLFQVPSKFVPAGGSVKLQPLATKDEESVGQEKETKLVNKCSDGVKCTEEEHQLNRRTEVKILSK